MGKNKFGIFNNINDIKKALKDGHPVYWQSEIYEVQDWGKQGLYCICITNGYTTGLGDACVDRCYIETKEQDKHNYKYYKNYMKRKQHEK